MREIKFRGKRIDNGDWVYGDLVHDHIGNNRPYIMSRDEGGCYITMQSKYMHAVDPATVGQYTGLKIDGLDLYEGDIVKCGNNEGVVKYTGIRLEPFDYISALEYTHGVRAKYTIVGTKIVGNIHDKEEVNENG